MADENTNTPAPRASGASLAAKLGGKLADARNTVKLAQGELATLKAELAALRARPTAEAQAAELEGLRAQVTTSKHRGEWDRAAKAAGVPEAALDDLFQLSGYKAEGEPDPAKIAEAVGAAVEPRKAWLGIKAEGADPDAPPSDAPPAPAPLPRGAGNARGGSDSRVGGMKVTAAQLNDMDFTRSNAAALREAARSGSLIVV